MIPYWLIGAIAVQLLRTRGLQRPCPFGIVFALRDGLLYIEPKAAR